MKLRNSLNLVTHVELADFTLSISVYFSPRRTEWVVSFTYLL